MTTFIIMGLCVWSNNVEVVMPPRLEEGPLLAWLDESGISHDNLIWVRDPSNDMGIRDHMPCYQTGLVIEDQRLAVLFKLRWGGISATMADTDVL